MDKPLEISFANMDASPAVEAEIRTRVARLERICDRIVHCRVGVELRQRQHRTGNLYEVHVTLALPGEELVVSREPHKAKERRATPGIRTSLRDAFKAAERQLKDFRQRRRGEVKPHPDLFLGQVDGLYPESDHGFILTREGTQLYFHRNGVQDGFDKLSRGDLVYFVPQVGDGGTLAVRVWRIAEPKLG